MVFMFNFPIKWWILAIPSKSSSFSFSLTPLNNSRVARGKTRAKIVVDKKAKYKNMMIFIVPFSSNTECKLIMKRDSNVFDKCLALKCDNGFLSTWSKNIIAGSAFRTISKLRDMMESAKCAFTHKCWSILANPPLPSTVHVVCV